MAHTWSFVRAGGFDQVELTSGADLEALADLDQKLWVALACPTLGIEFDARTLELVDADGDKRIRAPELLAAVKWACASVRDADTLVEGRGELRLDDIDADTDEGKLLKRTAKALLKSLGKADAKSISVDDATSARSAFEKERFNGDGVVPAASAEDEAVKAALLDVLACTEAPAIDKNGDPGVTMESIAAFFDELQKHVEWLEKGAGEAERPLGDDTDAAYAAYAAVRPKIEDYFARARVAAYDPRALAAVNGEEKQYLELAAKDLEVSAAEVERLPLALVQPDQPLPLAKGINPAWSARVDAFREKAVKPILGAAAALSEAQWKQVADRFAAHEAWLAAKAGASVEKLGRDRARELAASDLREKLEGLVKEDAEEEPQAAAIESVEKLVRLNRDLLKLLNNFVSFKDFYTRAAPAIFQIGTLYLDTRACELVVRVNDAGKHVTLAPMSNAYLVYCDCKNAKGETMQIAAAMTAGDVDYLMVGRNGLFYDRKGVDWDATVTRIVDNPISVRQAFWAPYKKVVRMIEERIARRAAEKAAERDAELTAGVNARADSIEAPPAAGAAPAPAEGAAPARPGGIDIGTLAAIGVAVGGITAALGAFLQAFFGLGIWIPFGILGIILLISGPSMAVAWLKLRKRNLGPILDANGWAVNAQAVVNVPLGGSLTKVAELPKGSRRSLSDPFAEKKRPWKFYLFLLVLLVLAGAWYLGKLDAYLPEGGRSTSVLGEHAPAAVHEDEPAAESEEPAAPNEDAPAAE